MILRIYAVVVGLAALVAGFFVLGESPVVSPGPLSDLHAELECRACHSPFQGTDSGCESCHGALHPDNGHRLAGIGCGDCHAEHRADLGSLVAGARSQCGECHAHASIEAVAAHAVGGTMERQIERGSAQRREASAFAEFSHEEHFAEAEVSDDPNCKTCHFLDEALRATQGGEQLLRWSGCEDCHDTWAAAGFPKARGRGMVTLELERFPRVAFSHSDEHLEAECEACHTGIRDAVAVGSASEPQKTSVGDLASCFGCHVHQPVGVSWAAGPEEIGDSEYEAGGAASCVGCHEFHGKGPEADFPDGPADEARPERWDVLARGADLTFTPWLVLFLGLGSAGWVIVFRRLPEARDVDLGANPDVAPQRVPEVPVLSPFYETSVSGLYIIGELAGVPLVNRAMKSGFDVIDFIANRLGRDASRPDDFVPEDELLDVVIVGSGPAGLGAATRAHSVGLRYVVCEKSTAAATIRDYPRAKVIQAAPVDIPDYGSFFQEDDESKDALVRRWEDIITRTGVIMREREEVVDIQSHPEGGLLVSIRTGKSYRTRNAVLAIGTRGTPRRLGVDGESAERVFYNLIDPDEFREKDILVVGGGNAAVEAALALSQPELLNRVTLAHRGPVLSGITPRNSGDIDAAAAEGQLRIVANAQTGEMVLKPASAVVPTPDAPVELPNDVIFALIGAELPIGFLRKVGVRMAKKGGL